MLFGAEKKLARKIVDRLMSKAEEWAAHASRHMQVNQESQISHAKHMAIAIALETVASAIADAAEIPLHELSTQ